MKTGRIVIVGAGTSSLMVGLLLAELQHQGVEVIVQGLGEAQERKPSGIGRLLIESLPMDQPFAPAMARRRGEKAQWVRERAGRWS